LAKALEGRRVVHLQRLRPPLAAPGEEEPPSRETAVAAAAASGERLLPLLPPRTATAGAALRSASPQTAAAATAPLGWAALRHLHPQARSGECDHPALLPPVPPAHQEERCERRAAEAQRQPAFTPRRVPGPAEGGPSAARCLGPRRAPPSRGVPAAAPRRSGARADALIHTPWGRPLAEGDWLGVAEGRRDS